MFARIFLDHPHSVGETYGSHARFAAGVGWELIRAGVTAIIHALIPCLFAHTTGAAVRRLYARVEGPRAEADRMEAEGNAAPAQGG